VLVTTNLYGDILSDIAAQIAGSVGLAGSANIGNHVALFEAIHGSAPDIAGKKIANPSGLLNAAIQMLVHINQPEIAAKIENAWLKTLEEGIHTADIYSLQHSKKKVNTDEFAAAVLERLGQSRRILNRWLTDRMCALKLNAMASENMSGQKKLLVAWIFLWIIRN